jgi:hypothetical protein
MSKCCTWSATAICRSSTRRGSFSGAPALPLAVDYRAAIAPDGRAVDEFYTVAPGQWTVITGVPGSGKSEWLDALLVNLAESEQWEFALYSPENFPTVTHLIKLVEKHERMPFGEGPTSA